MATKPTKKKPTAKHGLAVADPKTQTKAKAKARPPAKSKRVRVDGAVASLDEVLVGIGAERAEAVRQRVWVILNSFR